MCVLPEGPVPAPAAPVEPARSPAPAGSATPTLDAAAGVPELLRRPASTPVRLPFDEPPEWRRHLPNARVPEDPAAGLTLRRPPAPMSVTVPPASPDFTPYLGLTGDVVGPMAGVHRQPWRGAPGGPFDAVAGPIAAMSAARGVGVASTTYAQAQAQASLARSRLLEAERRMPGGPRTESERRELDALRHAATDAERQETIAHRGGLQALLSAGGAVTTMSTGLAGTPSLPQFVSRGMGVATGGLELEQAYVSWSRARDARTTEDYDTAATDAVDQGLHGGLTIAAAFNPVGQAGAAAYTLGSVARNAADRRATATGSSGTTEIDSQRRATGRGVDAEAEVRNLSVSDRAAIDGERAYRETGSHVQGLATTAGSALRRTALTLAGTYDRDPRSRAALRLLGRDDPLSAEAHRENEVDLTGAMSEDESERALALRRLDELSPRPRARPAPPPAVPTRPAPGPPPASIAREPAAEPWWAAPIELPQVGDGVRRAPAR